MLSARFSRHRSVVVEEEEEPTSRAAIKEAPPKPGPSIGACDVELMEYISARVLHVPLKVLIDLSTQPKQTAINDIAEEAEGCRRECVEHAAQSEEV